MSPGEIGGLLAGLGAFFAFIVSVLTWRSSKQGTRDANRLQREANQVAQRQLDLDTMESTIDTLRDNLADAQKETETLRADLGKARTEVENLNAEVGAALANVAILSDHIREHVPPEVSFPRLRRVR